MKKSKKGSGKKTTRKLIYIVVVFALLLLISLGLLLYSVFGFGRKPKTSEGWENRYFTLEGLKKYNGTDPRKPIYMGYEGKVYNVSTGAGFYSAGKTYNYLTGRDATTELNEVGVGEIIVRKYPVVGIVKN